MKITGKGPSKYLAQVDLPDVESDGLALALQRVLVLANVGP